MVKIRYFLPGLKIGRPTGHVVVHGGVPGRDAHELVRGGSCTRQKGIFKIYTISTFWNS